MSTRTHRTPLSVLALLLVSTTLMSGTSAAQQAFCDQGRLDSNYCNVTSQPDITGADYTDKTANIIVKGIDSGNRGRLYTEPVSPNQNDPVTANIETSGDFIVREGAAVHANINLSARNVVVEQGAALDASGLGYQPQAQAKGLGPGGGEGATSNSGAGAGGGAYGGRGGTFDNLGNTNLAPGGNPYGNPDDPVGFGSAGGGASKLDDFTDSQYTKDKFGHTDLGTLGGNSPKPVETAKTILRGATFGDGDRDDPDDDGYDSDRWVSTDREYRRDNPNDASIHFGAGGGRIRIVASKEVVVEGAILSNGIDASRDTSNSNNGGGGAGGAIYIETGGIFGDGTVMAKGGSYAERTDGSNSGNGKQIYQAAGGGGRIFYGYSIKGDNWDWSVSAEMGQSLIRPKYANEFDQGDLTSDFSGNTLKQDDGSRTVGFAATNGTVRDEILFSARVNETIVNPGDPIFINGTSNSPVVINISTPTGIKTYEQQLEPDLSQGGIYGGVRNVLTKTELENNDGDPQFGNYTLNATTDISDIQRSGTFEMSHRIVDIQQESHYLFRPGEQLDVTGEMFLRKENDEDYTSSDYNLTYHSDPLGPEDTEVEDDGTTGSPDPSFDFSRNIRADEGLKYYVTETVNENGIRGFDRKNLAWVDVNTTVVDPGQFIQINGTSHNKINVTLESPAGEGLKHASLDLNKNNDLSNGEDPYFQAAIQSLNRSEIDTESDLGNYTLTLKTVLNGQVRTEEFEISHREIEIDNQPDFILRPDENLRFSNFTDLIKQDGQGGKERAPYSGNIFFDYFNGSQRLNNTDDVPTNDSGGYSIFQEVDPTPGLKRFTLETENPDGINDRVRDNDLRNINNRSLAWVGVNDSIVDPEDSILVNGSAHNEVKIFLENQDNNFVRRKTLTRENGGLGSNGYFQTSVKSLDINSQDNFGNYTLRVNTSLNDETRTEDFEISHREIEVFNDPDYLLKAGEDLSLDNRSRLYREDKTDPTQSKEVAYSGGFTFRLLNLSAPSDGDRQLNERDVDSSASYELAQSIEPALGLRQYRVREVNDNGITETVEDEDLFEDEKKNLSWVDINDSIVDPGQQIQINGSAFNDVEVVFETPDGTETRDRITPDADTGFFEVDRQVATRDSIDEYSDLGNYSLNLTTELNGEDRTETFELSYREVEFFHGTDYMLRPGEDFTVNGHAIISREAGPVNETYDNQSFSSATAEEGLDFSYSFFTGQNEVSKTPPINESGNFSVENTMPDVKGDKSYLVEHVNQNGITYRESDNDLNNNSRERLGLVAIDDFIVNSGEQVKVNGTAYNPVEIYFDGTQVGSPEPDEDTGFYNHTFEVSDIQDTGGFGNSTIQVNTTLNGRERSESFEISIRGIRFNLDSSYPRRVDPGETFSVSGTAQKFVDDETGGSEPKDYSFEEIKLTYRDQNGRITTRTQDTGPNGDFSFNNLESVLNAGNRQITLSTTNSEGLNQQRSETLKTRVRVENSSTTSPSKRLFKDSALEQTRLVDPKQDVQFSVGTRKSLDFVKRVYANVTLPDGSQKQVELDAQGVLGDAFSRAEDWDAGATTHLAHSDMPGSPASNRLRIGYERNRTDSLLLNMPMEGSSGPVTDISGRGNNAETGENEPNRNAEGVFSTSGLSFGVSTDALEVDNTSALDLHSNFTLTAWVNPENNGVIYSRSNPSGDSVNPELRINGDGELIAEIQNGGDITEREAESTTDIVSGDQWHHIAARYNGTHLSVHVDGDREGLKQATGVEPPSFQQKPKIGETGTLSGIAYQGNIDSLKVFNESLSRSRIQNLGRRSGSFQTQTIETDKEVKDILKLIEFNGSLNEQEIAIRVLSDPNRDAAFEQSSNRIQLSDTTEIVPVTGLSNSSDRFKLNISFSTSDVTRSPLLSRIELRARKNPLITWQNAKPVKPFFGEQYGNYTVDYGAEDFGGNIQDTQLEESNFTVRDIVLEANHSDKLAPEETLRINGTVKLVKGDGSGGKSKQPFTGSLNVVFNDTVRGRNQIDEGLLLRDIGAGESRKVPVNGTLAPQNLEVTFLGRYAGVSESLEWTNATDWDQFVDRTGTSHSAKEDSPLGNETLTLGYNSTGGFEDSLSSYYAMDDSSLPLDDSTGTTDLDKVSSPQLESGGILSTPGVKLSQEDGFTGSSPISSQGPFTINAWVKPSSLRTGSEHTIFEIQNKLSLSLTGDGSVRAEATTGGTTSSAETDSGAVETGEWSMVTVRHNGQDLLAATEFANSRQNRATTGTNIPDLTANGVFVGVGSEQGTGFEGRIDELRVYEGVADPFRLRRLVREPEVLGNQQQIATQQKTFSEQVKPRSLVLEADAETNGRDAQVEVLNAGGDVSDPITLSSDKARYPISGGIEAANPSNQYSFRVEMESNITHAPQIDDLRLVQRQATERPAVDTDGDGSDDAGFSGKILGGDRQVVNLEDLSTGVNTASFRSQKGRFDARFNYTERLVGNKLPRVETNESGEFETNFTVPSFSGLSTVDYHVTNSRGIQGVTQTSLRTSLLFTASNVSDLENGDRVVDPQNSFQVNATIAPHGNPIDTMQAFIQTPDRTVQRELEKQGNPNRIWDFRESIGDIYAGDGIYNISLNVNDTTGLEELESPELSFNVTNGTVSVTKSDQTVGLGRSFTVNGTVRQRLTGERVNASVNITLPKTGETDIVDTDNSGFYNTTLSAPPSTTGNFPILVRTEDENNITALNSTTINVNDTNSFGIEVPETVFARDVTRFNGDEAEFTVNITNRGNTEIRNLEIFGEDLPTTEEYNEDTEGRKVVTSDWTSDTREYNISSGSREPVTAGVFATQASSNGEYSNLNLTARFETSGGETKRKSRLFDVQVTGNREPVFTENFSLQSTEGFEGNIIPPDQEPNNSIQNVGNVIARQVTWTVGDGQVKSWIEEWEPERNPGERTVPPSVSGISGGSIPGFSELPIFQLDVDIPEGTRPGNYTTPLETDSQDPTGTNRVNLSVEIPTKPTYEFSISGRKDGVQVPEGEINLSNPVDLGGLPTGSNERTALAIDLNNTGNRDLEWTLTTNPTTIGGVGNRVYFNASSKGSTDLITGLEDYESKLTPQENYTFDIPDRQSTLLFDVGTDAQAATVEFNLTINCVYPVGGDNQCRKGEVVIPMTAEIQDPKPELSDIQVSNATGVDDPIVLSGDVSDNSRVANVNVTIRKNLEGDTETETIEDLGLNRFDQNFSTTFTPTAEFSPDEQSPAEYSFVFRAEDNANQTTVSREFTTTVKDSASVGLTNLSNVVLDNVTADSSDTAVFNGTVVGGEVRAEDVSVETPNMDNFVFGTGSIDLGAVEAGETKDFEVSVESDGNPSTVITFEPTFQAFWSDPDGLSRRDVERATGSGSINVQPTRIARVDHFGSQIIEVDHGTTGTERLRINSSGNTRLEDVRVTPVQSAPDIFVSGVNRSDAFTIGPGESEVVAYNITVARGEPQKERVLDLKITHSQGTRFLNDTAVRVPEDRSYSIEPENFSAAIPSGQGVLNLTQLTVENTGNTDLQLTMDSNTTRQRLAFGEELNQAETLSLGPGERQTVNARAKTNNLPVQTQVFSGFAEGESQLDEADSVTFELFVQDIEFDVISQNRKQRIVEGDIIRNVFNLTQEDAPVETGSEVDITLSADGQTFDIPESYNETTELWTSEFQAPDIEDGVNHTFEFRVTSSAFRSSLLSRQEVSYKDITPPRFVNLTAEPIRTNENSTVSVVVEDNSDLRGPVTANFSGPGQFEDELRLEPQEPSNLSDVEGKEFTAEFTTASEKGLYAVGVTATDRVENTGSSSTEFFRVFEPLNVSGDAGEPADTTEIRLIDEGGDTAERVTPEDGRYNETIKSGTYSQAEIQVTNEKVTSLESLSASTINRSPPRFDARINDNLVNVDKQYLKGFALVSETFENVSGTVSFDYSDELGQVDFQGNLQVMKCEDYNLSEATPCQSGYETIDGNDTFIDGNTGTLAVDDISGFSSYILVEDDSSSENSNLNVNLTGELGNLENLSELSDLDSLLQQVAENTASSGTEGTAGDGGGGGSTDGGSGIGEGSEPLEEIASQLNESDEEQQDLAVGNSRVSVTLQPGRQKSTAVSVQNPREEEVSLSVNATENIRQFTSFEQSLDLQPGEFRTVRMQVNAENVTELREYTGFLRLSGPETDRSIPFNIEVVSAEKRLLDVTLTPTVDSFAPGQQARLKLEFINQGFTSSVDAVTSVKVEDIAGNETLARTTQTYAVQTTLDKIVELQVPEDADLGTYEASAQVEYANVPGNRSATAVAQVNIQRPFLQQRTLGTQNFYLVIAGFVLVMAASGGGYWYYRKKKLEAKRSRFEEQVDNDAIPGESGRTAFLGELSEIGTRAFLNLDDLMTHCLTAGATGAGKSVAAQVIVEEALEQGVNVIVLDPTGQWSGYLDKNEDDEFFAFYDDFGMKESDARSYEGNIRAVDAEQDTIDITSIMRPDGDEGSIHVFSMHKLENAELEEYLSDTIQQIFDYNPEEKDQLKTLICYDEAHRVLPKFGGTGRGVKMLERGAREFRKWGTGMLMISQVIEDFPEEVRANIGTQIQMRTEYEGDLDRIERKYGNNITQGVTKADTGTGMLQNSSYNHGRPYFVDFRPVKHSPERLSDEELDKFEKYNRRVDEIEDMIGILEDEDEDVFEYRSQLKLVKKNIRKRSFNLVDTYLDELEEDLNDELDI